MSTPDTTTIDIDDLARQSAQFEMRLHPVIAAISMDICSGCDEVCCKPEHCCETVESPWHRLVASRQTADLPPRGTATEDISFLTATGCRLQAGRPVQCTLFVCRRIDASLSRPLTRFVYHVLSGLPAHIMRPTSGYRHLMEVEDLDELTTAQRRGIQSRIREAEYCLDTCSELLAEDASEHSSATVDRILKLAALFPFAARSSG